MLIYHVFGEISQKHYLHFKLKTMPRQYVKKRENPFTQTLIVPFVRVVDLVEKQDDGTLKNNYHDVELEKFTRVYRNPHNLQQLKRLSSSALWMYNWLVYNATNKHIQIDDAVMSKEYDCSEYTAGEMRRELVDMAIIAKKHDNVYWLNPRYFCFDDRIKVYPDNAVRQFTIRKKDFQCNYSIDPELNCEIFSPVDKLKVV